MVGAAEAVALLGESVGTGVRVPEAMVFADAVVLAVRPIGPSPTTPVRFHVFHLAEDQIAAVRLELGREQALRAVECGPDGR